MAPPRCRSASVITRRRRVVGRRRRRVISGRGIIGGSRRVIGRSRRIERRRQDADRGRYDGGSADDRRCTQRSQAKDESAVMVSVRRGGSNRRGSKGNCGAATDNRSSVLHHDQLPIKRRDPTRDPGNIRTQNNETYPLRCVFLEKSRSASRARNSRFVVTAPARQLRVPTVAAKRAKSA
jgi:hypothetical protein